MTALHVQQLSTQRKCQTVVEGTEQTDRLHHAEHMAVGFVPVYVRYAVHWHTYLVTTFSCHDICLVVCRGKRQLCATPHCCFMHLHQVHERVVVTVVVMLKLYCWLRAHDMTVLRQRGYLYAPIQEPLFHAVADSMLLHSDCAFEATAPGLCGLIMWRL